MAVKQISAFDALIVRQAFEKLADSVTFTHQTNRTLRQAAHQLRDIAEQAAKKGQTAKQSEGGREGSLAARNAIDQSQSNIPPHPSVVAMSALVPVTDDIVQAVAGPMHEVIFGDVTEASVQRLRDAVAKAIAPKVPADSVDDVAQHIALFALSQRELMELHDLHPDLVALESEWSRVA